MNQLSLCCKSEIVLTGKERPEAFACKKCGRIIGTPLNSIKLKMKNLIKILTWTDLKEEKRLKRKLAPTWMFFVEFLLGLAWWIVGFFIKQPLVAFLGGVLAGLGYGAFTFRIKNYQDQK